MSFFAALLILLAACGMQLAIGIAVGRRLPRRRSRPATESARERLNDLREWATRVNDQVASHQGRIQEIQGHLTEQDGAALAAAGELLGANEMLLLQLASARQELAEQAKQLEAQTQEARTDPLTRLANRRAFDEELERRIAQWRRQQSPVSVLVIDVDFFKKVNDHYGHQAGDLVLQHVARALQRTMRDMDLVARYGGEEFVVLLPGTPLADAKRAAERVRKAIESTVVGYQERQIRITASVGLAQAVTGDDASSLVARADEALYAAKQNGRNRCYLHDGEACLPIEGSEGLPPQPVVPGPPDEPIELPEEAVVELEAAVRRVEERRRRDRREFRATQFIAPFVDGRLPPAGAFREVQCVDVSPAGFSFLAETFPETDSLVVEFGVPPNLIYIAARVVHCTRVDDEGQSLYKIGCRFSRRLRFG